jgi:hypothetical protein
MCAKQVLYCLSHVSSPFCSGYFGAVVAQIICHGWPGTETILNHNPDLYLE